MACPLPTHKYYNVEQWQESKEKDCKRGNFCSCKWIQMYFIQSYVFIFPLCAKVEERFWIELRWRSSTTMLPKKWSEFLFSSLYIFINKDGNSSTKCTRHVDANVNTQKENQNHQNSTNEMEDVMLKGHPMPQIS